MKRYKLLKDLPTFNAGETFFLDDRGNLCAEETQGHKELVAYAAITLEKFPNILEEWFEEIEEEWQPWRVEKGELYWFIADAGFVGSTWENFDTFDEFRYGIGNYFKTKEEAKRALAKLKAYATVKGDAKGYEWSENKDNAAVYWDCDSSELEVSCDGSDFISPYCVYFRTENDAYKSIRKHRKEWGLLLGRAEENE